MSEQKGFRCGQSGNDKVSKTVNSCVACLECVALFWKLLKETLATELLCGIRAGGKLAVIQHQTFVNLAGCVL